jgi:GAF domain-containing protein/anti-sigma regulatory factor (Ser/Thr protein kinase)
MVSENVDRIEKILKSVNQKVQRLLKPDRFYVAFYDAERSELTFPWVVEDGQAQWDPRPYAGSEDTKGDQGNGHIRLPDLVIAQVVPQLFEENVGEQLMGAGVTYWPDDELPKSWLGAPLTSRDDTFGALVVESHTAHAFGDRGAQILSTIARQTAVAIENARLYDQLKRKIADLSAVNEIGRELTSGIRLEEQEILDLIHQQASQLMDTSNMYIALYDEETDTVSFDLMLVDGEPEEVASRSGGKGRTEWIIHNRKPILIKTRAESEAWYEKPGRDEYYGDPLASWVGVPMMTPDEVLGVIAAYHKTDEYLYDDDDRQILSSMANQSAIALDNARLYECLEDRVKERTEQLAALQDIGVKITSQLDPDEVLSSIAKSANDLLPADFSSLFVYDPQDDKFKTGIRRKGEKEVTPSIPSGEGAAGRIAKSQQAQFVEDTKAHPGLAPVVFEDKEMRAFAGVPLVAKGKTVGVLYVNFLEPHQFSAQERETLKLLTNQAAIALDNARLYKEAREEVIAAKQLGTLGTAIAALQHRINNTFNIIVPNVMRLRNRVDMSDETIVEILDIIERNARYTSNIIGRIQEPLREVEIQDVDVNAVLDEVANMTKKQGGSEIAIKQELNDEIPLIQASIGQITEVFRNLADNACRAMKGDGQLIIASDFNDGIISVRVEDTGPGIPPKIQERLFKKPVPSKEPGGGAGLGLWLSQLMLQTIGGDVEIEKTGPTGTTMLVQIPASGAGGV